MKTFITTEIYNEADQKMLIQPTPEFDAIELHTSEIDGSHQSGAFFITKKELPVIIEKLQEMMNYINN